MLNPNERDILREVGNIGAGHAATALSTLLGQPIEIEVPSAELEDFTTIVERSGGAETYTAGALLRFSGDIQATLLFLMPLRDAEKLVSQLMQTEFHFFPSPTKWGFPHGKKLGIF